MPFPYVEAGAALASMFGNLFGNNDPEMPREMRALFKMGRFGLKEYMRLMNMKGPGMSPLQSAGLAGSLSMAGESFGRQQDQLMSMIGPGSPMAGSAGDALQRFSSNAAGVFGNMYSQANLASVREREQMPLNLAAAAFGGMGAVGGSYRQQQPQMDFGGMISGIAQQYEMLRAMRSMGSGRGGGTGFGAPVVTPGASQSPGIGTHLGIGGGYGNMGGGGYQPTPISNNSPFL